MSFGLLNIVKGELWGMNNIQIWLSNARVPHSRLKRNNTLINEDRNQRDD